MNATTHAPILRSLYRRILRELPSRQPSNLANPSPIQRRIRAQFSSDALTASSSVPTSASPETPGPGSGAIDIEARIRQVDQFVQYLKAQRTYLVLLERYNPGIAMDEEEKVRLTARKVGMNLPIEWQGWAKE